MQVVAVACKFWYDDMPSKGFVAVIIIVNFPILIFINGMKSLHIFFNRALLLV